MASFAQLKEEALAAGASLRDVNMCLDKEEIQRLIQEQTPAGRRQLAALDADIAHIERETGAAALFGKRKVTCLSSRSSCLRKLMSQTGTYVRV